MAEFEHKLTTIVGPAGIVTDENDRARYLTERRGRWYGEASLIVRPKCTAEVSQIVKLCSKYRRPIVPQGGNTGLVGGQIPTDQEIIVSLERMRTIRTLDPEGRTITVDAGCVLATVQTAAENEGLLFPLSLASEGTAQIGGLLATNAGGTAVLRYGTMRNLVLGLEVVTPDGDVWNGLSRLHKDNTGYHLQDLFIGAEGTLGIITAAVCKLVAKPGATIVAFVSVADPRAAIALLNLAQESSGGSVSSFEIMSENALDMVLKHGTPDKSPLSNRHDWYVLVEMTGNDQQSLQSVAEAVFASALQDGLILDAAIAQNERQGKEFWALREEISEAQRHEGVSLKHDICVPVASIPIFLTEATKAVTAEVEGIRAVPFGHIGDGNIHYNLSQPKDMSAEAFEAKREPVAAIVHEIAHGMGGSFSAEHGVGVAKKSEFLKFKDPTAHFMMKKIKQALDPHGIMNPGKIFD